jgi:hypothetical protein
MNIIKAIQEQKQQESLNTPQENDIIKNFAERHNNYIENNEKEEEENMKIIKKMLEEQEEEEKRLLKEQELQEKYQPEPEEQ